MPEFVGYFYGLGALIVAFAAYSLGRISATPASVAGVGRLQRRFCQRHRNRWRPNQPLMSRHTVEGFSGAGNGGCSARSAQLRRSASPTNDPTSVGLAESLPGAATTRRVPPCARRVRCSAGAARRLEVRAPPRGDVAGQRVERVDAVPAQPHAELGAALPIG
jgi:hypothetical protein